MRDLAEGLRETVLGVEHKLDQVNARSNALEHAVGDLQNDIQILQQTLEEERPPEHIYQETPATHDDRVTAAPAPPVPTLPELRPLFGSTNAVGDHVREAAESEASLRVGSHAGNDNAQTNTR